MNTYEAVAALVPQGESFDHTAVNEGVWLTQGHLANIEVALLNAGAEKSDLQQQIDALFQEKEESALLQQQAVSDLEAKDNEIASLQAEIERLKQAPAGEFQQTTKEKDEHGGGTIVEESEITKEARRLRELRDQAKKATV